MHHPRSARPLLAAVAVGLFVLASCGGDDDGGADATTAAVATTDGLTATTDAPATTESAATTESTAGATAAPMTAAAPTTAQAAPSTEGAPATTGGGNYVAGADPAADAAADAVVTVFDSAAGIEAKIPLLEDGEALRPVLESYVMAAQAVGEITVEPTAVTLDGQAGTVAYDLLFAGTNPYPDAGLSAEVVMVEGTWQVSRDAFCGFMAQARNACP